MSKPSSPVRTLLFLDRRNSHGKDPQFRQVDQRRRGLGSVIPTDLQQYMLYGGWFNSLSIDPTDHLHLGGGTHTGRMRPYSPNCLAETRDGGKTSAMVTG